MNQEKIWIAGCGDLGLRLVDELDQHRYQVFGVRRSPQLALASQHCAAKLYWRRADVSNKKDLGQLFAEGADIVIATLTPSNYTPRGYQHAYIDTAKALTQTLRVMQPPPRLFIWVSSTRVYGQSSEVLIDENTPPKPDSFQGETLLAAEKIVQKTLPEACIVRFSGIYGRGRNRLLAKVRSGLCEPATPARFSNRIHVEDAVGFITHLIERQRRGLKLEPLYLGTDCTPVEMFKLQAWLAEAMGNTAADLREEAYSKPRSSKKLSNRRMLNSGYSLRYPDYRSGYRTLLDQNH